MWLLKNGVREEIAWELSDEERLARCIVFARFEGNEFDWNTLSFRRP